MKVIHTAESGFTLVELLVAIVVAAVVTASLNQVVTSYIYVNQRGRDMSLANSFVESKVEALRNAGYNALPAGTTDLSGELSNQLPPNRSASMQVSSPSAGLKKIDITVSYVEQGKNNSFSYTTYLGELGVGQ